MTGLCVTGLSHVLPRGEARPEPACDPTPFLRVRKNRKFMGLQDEMAVVAAGRALQQAGLSADLGADTGLYLCSGYIPFEEADLQQILRWSLDDGRFSMARFAAEAVQRAHPLLTFRCLPNMPAFHISVNFALQGPYVVTYPGAGQLYQALELAAAALQEGRISRALVVGVAHQQNFLVRHHLARLEPPVPPEQVRDAAGCLVLETEAAASARGAAALLRLGALRLEYDPAAPELAGDASEGLGAAAPLVYLSQACAAPRDSPERAEPLRHEVAGRDGLRARSEWWRG